ncbi:alpha/beta hydrolase [Paenibacillus sp. GCM10027628]|uniref:alpha/beta hydrolase n=1 Tax=Paenibacillus sp. GCM10027628 TaxID=3273413 RepID=UPI0036312F81
MDNKEPYATLVSLLEENAVVVKRNNYDYVVKPIPDSDAEGQLDPRVHRVQQQQAEAMASADRPIFDPSDIPNFVKTMRAVFGWKNDDVTRSEIATVYKTIDGTNGPIPLRIYTPAREGRMPAVVFFHGGGFLAGTVGVVENPCKALAEKAGAVVVSVDYRLAPEHAFPAGLTDCFESVQWVYEHAGEIGVNPQQIAVSGDSAGGNLATVCALMDRDKGTGMIQYQALIYPTVNMVGVETEDFKWSLDEYDIRNHHELIVAGVKGLGGMGNLILDLYLQNNAEPTDPYVAPLLAEHLSGMPETLIVTAEYDYLRLECESYARKLSRSGVSTKLIQYNGMDHAFLDKTGLYPQAEDCVNEIAKEMKRIFS